ncbi:NAD(P)/FAD-dependent oxidoreductase [Dongia soli]|uniref:FAD-dependent oxidoreductase n=1 Tax=Dongia soli TaxID=600628 RepID=A0ABU5EB68_9PROT|nr:FAD-dependent oxidoreductase [Dongia soli]MDY0883101.1 FAD-dependent oxidoreductase [Dongia soli]
MSSHASVPNHRTDYDVIIIGAGIIGVAIACYLQQSGQSVALIDKKGIGLETSKGNAGAFAFSDIMPLASPGIILKAPKWLFDPLGPLTIPPRYLPKILPWLIRFGWASRSSIFRKNSAVQAQLMKLAAQEAKGLLAARGALSMLRSDGALELYESEREFKAALPGWKLREEQGIEFRHVRGAELAELQPGLSPSFVCATFTPKWQTVSDPYLVVKHLGESVLDNGGQLIVAGVRKLQPAGEGAEVILDDGRRLRSRNAIVASGAWSKTFAADLGDPVPLETERGYNTTLPVSAFDLKRQLIFGGHGFVMTPLSTGIRVGGAVELGGLDLPPNFRRSDAMLQKAAKFLPGLKTEGGTQWMGYRPSLPDSLPVIGPSTASRQIIYAFGHGHLGLTQSAATGRLVTDLVLKRTPAMPVEPFSASRF